MKRSTILAYFLPVFALTAFTFGQSRVSHSVPEFSASFRNGPVTKSDWSGKTGSESKYWSCCTDRIGESILVRKFNSDLAVDYSTTDAYSDSELKILRELPDAANIRVVSSHGTYQGHPYTYSVFENTYRGVPSRTRVRYIIVDSHTVFKISEDAPPSTEPESEWRAFADSLVIK